MGVWIATGALGRVRLLNHPLWRRPCKLQLTNRCVDRYPNRSSRNFCIFGTQPIYLADHIFVARRRGEDVEAFDSGRRCGGLARAVGPAQGESAKADGAGLSHHRHPRGRIGRLLDPPRSAERRNRKPRCRCRVDFDLAPPAPSETDGIDGETLVRTLLAYKRGEPRVCAMVKAPTPEEEDRRRICRERKTLVGERVGTRQPDQGAALRPRRL